MSGAPPQTEAEAAALAELEAYEGAREHGISLRDLHAVLGLPKERVRLIEARALDKMRRALARAKKSSWGEGLGNDEGEYWAYHCRGR